MHESQDERREAHELDSRILSLIESSSATWVVDDTELGALAGAVFAYQCRQQPILARFAEARAVDTESVRDWRDIPPVPARAFKTLRFATFDRAHTLHTFRSSGTTARSRSELELDTLALYEASLLATFQRFVFPDAARSDWLALVLDPASAPESSLAHMVGVAGAELADSVTYAVNPSGLDIDLAIERLAYHAARQLPLFVVGTAFSIVHLVDALAERRQSFVLARGSRVMETGGFKGRSRVLSRDKLYAAIHTSLGVPDDAIVSEYGMTELGSQYYDSTLRDAVMTPGSASHGTVRVKQGPPWASVRVVDPLTTIEVADGEAGTLLHFDLTGRGSLLAILTEDRGRRVGGSFELLGRVSGAEPRGCSIAYDALLRSTGETRDQGTGASDG